MNLYWVFVWLGLMSGEINEVIMNETIEVRGGSNGDRPPDDEKPTESK